MTIITPTLSQQRWGQDVHQIFDYLASPVRMTGGNPVLFHRIGGGGMASDYRALWDSVYGEIWYFYNWLTTTASALAQPFDICAINTVQRSQSGPTIRSKKSYILDDVREWQVATAEVKRLGKIGFGASNQYLINPNKVIVGGDSFGGTIAMLSQLFPPFIGNGAQTTNMYRPYCGAGFSSQARGVLNHIGQIDARTIGGVNQQAYSSLHGWFGTRSDDGGTEFTSFPDSIKAAASVRAYIQSGDTQYYRPIFNLYTVQGDHIHPYSNAHDNQQLTEINSDLNAAGLLHGKYLYSPGDLQQSGGTGPRALAAYNAIYNFMAARVTSTEVLASLPVP